jgi:hypothetical protein
MNLSILGEVDAVSSVIFGVRLLHWRGVTNIFSIDVRSNVSQFCSRYFTTKNIENSDRMIGAVA